MICTHAHSYIYIHIRVCVCVCVCVAVCVKRIMHYKFPLCDVSAAVPSTALSVSPRGTRPVAAMERRKDPEDGVAYTCPELQTENHVEFQEFMEFQICGYD